MPSEITALGIHAGAVQEAADALQRDAVISRIWDLDYTVWRDDPAEISDRLGWLTINEEMRRQLPSLRAFAEEVRDAGMKHVVLLAMGGSALAPEVYRATLGSSSGYPELIMLDSTVPDWVRRVSDAVDPASTLFIVSSKSGGTIEVLSFYRHFHALVEAAMGAESTGSHFVAVTDEGTVLDAMGKAESFRRVFINPPDVGGRFSGLSLFGFVPAALMGIDLERFLDGVESIRERCGPATPLKSNPGAWLGTVMGALAKKGVDKLTLVTSPALVSFGLWTEQMLAESLGKEGTGILPVAGEPLAPAGLYGDDRLFVYLRLQGDDNDASDAHIKAVQDAGHPTLCLEMPTRDELGGELFRWAFATAVAGHLLGVHPFDQPNVQQAKDLTGERLKAYERDGRLPPTEIPGSVESLLSQAKPHDYLAILAYLAQSPEMDEALARLRRAVQARHRIATTAGYGPRYLHSTGQLHKGGPPSGLFLQLVGEQTNDVEVPGRPYTFGVLATAQADGDISALQQAGRSVARCHLGPDPVRALEALAELVSPDAG